MCFTNTPRSIKLLSALCFFINMSNLVYLFVRYQELIPATTLQLRDSIHSVMPDVKNIDKYMERKSAAIFLGGFAGISALFDFILYIGVDRDRPRLILAAWAWGVVDCSFDAAIGIASGNMSFMDGLARTLEPLVVTEPTPKPLQLPKDFPRGPDSHRAFEQPVTPRVLSSRGKSGPDNKSAPSLEDLDTQYQSTVVDHNAFRLTNEQTAALVLYVLFRLIFKTVALAGIKDFASRVSIELEKRELALRLGYEAESVSLNEPPMPSRPKSDRGLSKPSPVLPRLSPSRRTYEPPPARESPRPIGFLFPPPTVPPYPTVDPMP